MSELRSTGAGCQLRTSRVPRFVLPTCWENRRGDALRLNSDQASHRMLAAKWQPLEQYPGTVEAPWLAQCLVCNETG